jgi:hypothetical protein
MAVIQPVTETVSLLIRILEVFCPNLRKDTLYFDVGFHGYPQSLRTNARNYIHWASKASSQIPSNLSLIYHPTNRHYAAAK